MEGGLRNKLLPMAFTMRSGAWPNRGSDALTDGGGKAMDAISEHRLSRFLRYSETALRAQAPILSSLIDRVYNTDTHVLVLGDAMLDVYVQGVVERVSPEAPVPIIRHEHTRCVAGGAANVSVNLTALGGRATLIAAVGSDAHALELRKALDGASVRSRLAVHPTLPTVTKTRLLVGQHQLLRLDHERLDGNWCDVEAGLLAAFEEELPAANILVISDYNKGLLSEKIIQHCISAAQRRGTPILVDPKKPLSVYRGATVIKPNREELSRATGLAMQSDEDVLQAANLAATQTGASIVLTMSERGMSLFEQGRQPRHIPTFSREVFDVSGAGDTAMAAMALAVGAGAPLGDAMVLGNAAAGLSISKVGTATVSLAEIMAAYVHGDVADGVVITSSLDEASALALEWRKRGLTVGFTNGCFDLLHPGHVETLRRSSELCDRLFVGINSDRSVASLKGPARPVQRANARAEVVGAIKGVGCVVIFDDETPLRLIQAIRPDVLIKGADYDLQSVVGREFVESYGGRCELVQVVAGHSTTRLIEASQRAQRAEARDVKTGIASQVTK